MQTVPPLQGTLRYEGYYSKTVLHGATQQQQAQRTM
jgi:hypothetical protein